VCPIGAHHRTLGTFAWESDSAAMRHDYLHGMRLLLLFLAASGHCVWGQAWEQLPDFPGTARDDAASFTIDGAIYVGTGMELGWGLTNDWYVYDTQAGAWWPIAPLPATPRQYCSSFVLEGKGYLFGGIDADGPLNELWCFDPATNTWSAKAPLPGEGRYACVSAGLGSTGHVATGMLASGSPTNEHWLYNANVDQWFPSQPVPGPARHRAAAFLTTAFTVIGGADAAGEALSDAWSYEALFPTGEWETAPPLPDARFGARGITGWNAVVGGASDWGTFHADAWTLQEGAWLPMPAFSGGARRGAATAGIPGPSGGAYMGTGLSSELVRQRDWWMLRPLVGIAENIEGTLSAWPNPSAEWAQVDWSPADGPAAFAVHDALGRLVASGTLRSGDRIDLRTLPEGQYLLHVAAARAMRTKLLRAP